MFAPRSVFCSEIGPGRARGGAGDLRNVLSIRSSDRVITVDIRETRLKADISLLEWSQTRPRLVSPRWRGSGKQIEADTRVARETNDIIIVKGRKKGAREGAKEEGWRVKAAKARPSITLRMPKPHHDVIDKWLHS